MHAQAALLVLYACQAVFMVCYVITNTSSPYKIGCNNVLSAMLIPARFAHILCVDVHIWLTKFCIAGRQQPTELKPRRLACFAAQLAAEICTPCCSKNVQAATEFARLSMAAAACNS